MVEKKEQVTALKAKDDFRVDTAVYIGAVFFVFAGAVTSLRGDIERIDVFSVISSFLVLAVILLSLALFIAKRIERNTSFASIVYASMLNFLGEVLQISLVGAGDISAELYMYIFLVTIFLSISGFMVGRAASLILGGLSVLVFSIAAIVHPETHFSTSSVFLLIALTGIVFILFRYRTQLERLVVRLHEAKATTEKQRDEVAELKIKAEVALEDLKKAQTRIVAQEKLASLGALTAGIAHEIKNPLNFINNFSESSVELIHELEEHLQKSTAALDPKVQDEVSYLLGELRQNMIDIHSHGKRGDHIVKSMLMHSRTQASSFTLENIKDLAQECLNLAYHGMRAQDSSFQAKRSFSADQDLAPIEIVRGDISRVFINLSSNAFYSVKKKAQAVQDSSYLPEVQLRVLDSKDSIRVEIQDNGLGIDEATKSKLFVPFFTTKPTGEGTGLGLSMSHEIVAGEHGGSIQVESETGKGATFIVVLPKRRQGA